MLDPASLLCSCRSNSCFCCKQTFLLMFLDYCWSLFHLFSSVSVGLNSFPSCYGCHRQHNISTASPDPFCVCHICSGWIYEKHRAPLVDLPVLVFYGKSQSKCCLVRHIKQWPVRGHPVPRCIKQILVLLMVYGRAVLCLLLQTMLGDSKQYWRDAILWLNVSCYATAQ